MLINMGMGQAAPTLISANSRSLSAGDCTRSLTCRAKQLGLSARASLRCMCISMPRTPRTGPCRAKTNALTFTWFQATSMPVDSSKACEGVGVAED